MSPGPAFERVYLALKRQLREGTRPPGAPLEPSVIGDELGTSFTPVRDALHRLVGEDLVENPKHNGFAVPRLSEQALRDLYGWNGEVIGLIAQKKRGATRPIILPAGATDRPPEIADIFLAIAEASSNREHARAVAHLNDRLAPYRLAELNVLADTVGELASLCDHAAGSRPSGLRMALTHYHRRRINAAPRILSLLLANA
jgi:DNA-binding FadR family transcriptional regulator